MDTEQLTQPPCELDPNRKYSIVLNGAVIDSTNCIFDARRSAAQNSGELWRRGREGFPSVRVAIDQ